MEKIEVKSYEGAGNIKFGDKRTDVRNNNGTFKEFRKSRFSKNTTDDFGKFHVYYDQNDNVIAIEFFKDSNLSFCGNLLFTKSFIELKSSILDSNMVEDSCSITYKTLGFSIYSPDKLGVESIIVFSKGYYG